MRIQKVLGNSRKDLDWYTLKTQRLQRLNSMGIHDDKKHFVITTMSTARQGKVLSTILQDGDVIFNTHFVCNGRDVVDSRSSHRIQTCANPRKMSE